MQKNWYLVNMADNFFSNHQRLKSTVTYFPDRMFFSNSTHTCSIEITVTDVDEEEQRKNQKHISKSVYI